MTCTNRTKVKASRTSAVRNQELLAFLLKKRNRLNYRAKKIEKLTDDEIKSKDIKELQKLNKQKEKVNSQIRKAREKIKRKQVTSAYATVVRRSNLTAIDRKALLARNWYNTDWLDGHENLTKMQEVQHWQAAHPLGTKADCERDTKMSHHTIDKWWIA